MLYFKTRFIAAICYSLLSAFFSSLVLAFVMLNLNSVFESWVNPNVIFTPYLYGAFLGGFIGGFLVGYKAWVKSTFLKYKRYALFTALIAHFIAVMFASLVYYVAEIYSNPTFHYYIKKDFLIMLAQLSTIFIHNLILTLILAGWFTLISGVVTGYLMHLIFLKKHQSLTFIK